ncbi:MAG: hypothetical protein ABIR11_09545 [Candidatus Limnocylindrales bacterium]
MWILLLLAIVAAVVIACLPLRPPPRHRAGSDADMVSAQPNS